MTFHNLQSHLACGYIKTCVLIRHTFCESLVMLCATKLKCRSFLLYFFFRHRVVSLHKLVQAGARTQTTTDSFYMVEPHLRKSQKKNLHKFNIKVNQNIGLPSAKNNKPHIFELNCIISIEASDMCVPMSADKITNNEDLLHQHRH